LVGFRLKPGASIDQSRLLHAIEIEHDSDVIANRIRETCFLSSSVHEALASLASSTTVTEAAGQSGVRPRTFQRRLLRETGHPPQFWLQLARVRRAARGLATAKSLAELAVDAGFSDQAHMTRQFRLWFAITPAQFATNTVMRNLVHEPGYD